MYLLTRFFQDVRVHFRVPGCKPGLLLEYALNSLKHLRFERIDIDIVWEGLVFRVELICLEHFRIDSREKAFVVYRRALFTAL
jgi:hypothetical protein